MTKLQPIRLEFTLPLRTITESNANGHWRAKAKRAAEQRTVTRMILGPKCMEHICSLQARIAGAGLVITLTRFSAGTLDDDNLQSALKHVRDGVADALWMKNDAHVGLTWRYRQAKIARGTQPSVFVEIASKEGETK